MKKLPKMAVLFAAFNGMRWLPEQLDSILAQKDVLVKLFISVDRSTDGTENWFDQRAVSDNRIICLEHSSQFGGAAPNFFRLMRDVDFSEYDYVSFADQDDIWFSNKLSRAHEIMSNNEADAYSSNVTAVWSDGRKVLINKAQPQVQWDFLFEAAGPGCTYVMKKTLACAVQDVLTRHWLEVQQVGLHDWFTYAFARANGFRWIIDDVPGLLYRQHENNQVGVNAGWRAFVYRANKVLSGWGLMQSALIARLVGLTDDPFVSSWSGGSRLGLLYLALQARHCRRRTRDKFVFGLSCLVLIVMRRSR